VRLILRRIVEVLMAVTLALPAAAGEGESHPAPATVIETMTRSTIEALPREGTAMAADPEHYYALARNTLKPFFDLDRAGRVILGPSWVGATAAERDAFQRAFEDYLVTSYAVALRHVTATTLTVAGEPRPVGAAEVLMPVRLVLVDGETLEAELRMRLGPSGWQIWDAGAGGLSVVKLYRGDIGTEAAVHGVARVVDSLRSMAARNRARNTEEARERATTQTRR
jgi:phospholipid transport system substrate-binding protein